MFALSQRDPVATAIEAITNFGRVVSPSETRQSATGLWRKLWSFLLQRVEHAFRSQTMVGNSDFGLPLNIVALAVGFGNEEENKLGRKWLETLCDQIGRKIAPNELIAHLDVVESMFPRLCEMHKMIFPRAM